MNGDLANVKPGDRLTIYGGGWSATRIVKIDRVTPGGRVICGHDSFRPDGRRVGGRSGFGHIWARPATEADIAKAHRESLVASLERGTKWSEIPTELMERIAAILKEPRA